MEDPVSGVLPGVRWVCGDVMDFRNMEFCMEQLPEDQKKVISLFYLEGKCYNEITSMTGLDWNKVRSHIQNGRRNLKICMENQQEKPVEANGSVIKK